MSTLYKSRIRVDSVFQLLGNKENDITFSLAWAFANSDSLLRYFIENVFGEFPCGMSDIQILIQDYKKPLDYATDQRRGFTDIEITDDKKLHIIIEAKRGWLMPGMDQLTKYSGTFSDDMPYKKIVTMSECTQKYVSTYYPPSPINGVDCLHLSWRQIYEMSLRSIAHASNHKEIMILKEFIKFLGGLLTMQKIDSNWVYVVSLSDKHPDGCELSYIEIVKKKNLYFCPYAQKGWPKQPPNYIAFRYGGKLQSIHHINSYVISHNLHEHIPEMPDCMLEIPHFVFSLGEAICPMHEVKTGNIYRSGRKWAMLDLLLTSNTISEAAELSKQRQDVDLDI